MENELTIVVQDTDGVVRVDALIQILENTIKALKHIVEQLGADSDAEWVVVAVKMESPMEFRVAPRGRKRARAKAGRAAQAYYRAVREIKTRASMPEYFDEDSLELLKNVVQPDAQVAVAFENESPVVADKAVTEHIDQVVHRTIPLYENGTIEGTLEVVSKHNADSFFIWETFTKYRVECFGDADQLNLAAKLFLELKRVAVSGRIKHKAGRPVSIHDAVIKVLRDQNELPQPDDFGDIDITGGKPSEDFVREFRDAQ